MQRLVAENKRELEELQTQFFDRDKPFYQTFGEELIAHKSFTQKLFTEIKQELISKGFKSVERITSLECKVALLETKTTD